MHKYKIEGGIPIRGTVEASGNKNAALPCIAATLLSEEPIILRNIPEIEDTNVMLLILQALGASVTKLARHEWKIEAKTINSSNIPSELSKKIRASILFAGPLTASSTWGRRNRKKESRHALPRASGTRSENRNRRRIQLHNEQARRS